MGTSIAKWFVPVMNSVGNGLSFPVSEDAQRALRGLREEYEEEVGDGVAGQFGDEDRVFRRDQNGRWMVHD